MIHLNLAYTISRAASTIRCALLVLLFSSRIAPFCNADWEGAEVTKVRVDKIPTDYGNSIAHSMTREGCRLALLVGSPTAGYAVRVDGIEGRRYEKIAEMSPNFSPNGQSIAYCARMGYKEWRWVVNGVEGPIFEALTPTSFAFSPDGKHHAYVAIPGFRQNVVVVDGKVFAGGKRGGVIPWDAAPVYSPNGSRLAWVELSHELGKRRVNLDGEPGPWTENIGAKNAEFGAFKVIQGGRVFARTKRMEFMLFLSPDSAHFAYGEVGGESSRKVIDGVPGPFFEAVGIDHAFSPNGSDYAYVAKQEGKWAVYRENGEPFLIEAIYDNTLIFSPDGRKLAFGAIRDGKPNVWIEGNAATCDVLIKGIAGGGVIFSPDSKRFAFPVVSQTGLHWVVDGKAGPVGEGLGDLDFSPDSGRFAYTILRTKEKGFGIVVDGKIRANHVPYVFGPVFRNDGRLEYLATNEEGAIYRFTISGY